QLQAKLSHPNVAGVHAFLQEGDKQLIVMEYVAGVSLDEFVRAGGPVPVPRALEIFRRALDGIDHAHGHGIVHRDIKPANIMLADSGQVKVMDFGIARALDSQEHLTRIGHVAGTAKAMSPEQIRGKQADVRSDIYSLGIVLYTLLAGRAPFDHGNDLELMKAQLEQAPPPLGGQLGSVPPKVEAVVMRALEKDPAARFQTVGDFARAIDACIATGAPAAAAPVADRMPEAATTSRTAINPALQGVKRLPAGSALRDERTVAKPRSGPPAWIWVGVSLLAIAALGVGGAMLWSQFSPTGESSVATRPAPAARVEPEAPPVAPPSAAPARPADAVAPAAAPAIAMGPTVTEPPPSPPAPLPTSPLPTAPLPAAAPADATAAMAPRPSTPAAALRTLTIAPVGSGGKAVVGGADGLHRFRPGESIRLQVTSSDAAHLYCYLQDETQRILRFYPNRFSKSARVAAKTPLEIPGKMRFELVANTLRVPETVACFASERDVAGELPASVMGEDFVKLPAASLDEVRDAFARVATPRLAEGRFQIDFK
ncbi:MAG TPA: serine/threonine-protein kinase, partial [Burkholderiaceae bacterium]|nr:serine/threonine-protein kinase [Burkholderiaceae bacterium]